MNSKKTIIKESTIKLNHGSGGKEMQELISKFRHILGSSHPWKGSTNDAALLDLSDGQTLSFTTDSFTVDPLFFPGGNIGDLAMCGTINDIAVMGQKPLGISLSFIIEEGFLDQDLQAILHSISNISKNTCIPIVTGDTKVIEKGKIDGIIINTSAVAISKKQDILTRPLQEGDKVIISGSIGDHAIALLSKRFDYKTNLITDSKPLIEEISSINKKIRIAKDPTRGGLAACLNEICTHNKVGMNIQEHKIPIKKEVKSVTHMLGLDPYELACEGRFICISSKDEAIEVERILKTFNHDAAIIGTITNNKGKVILKTQISDRVLVMPHGSLIPRIC